MLKSKKIKIGNPNWPDFTIVSKEIIKQISSIEDNDSYNQKMLKVLCDVATNAWKAKGRIIDKGSGEPKDDMKKIFRNIEEIIDSVKGLGFEIIDRTGEVFDYGLPEKVIATRPTEGISHETVVEMIKPTICFHGKIIQYGQVELAVPVKNNN